MTAPHCLHKAFFPEAPPPLDASPERLARERRRREKGLLRGIVDVHTHPFPPGFMRAIRDWFDANAWKIQFRGSIEEGMDALHGAGVETVLALVYAHKPGIARMLNAHVGELSRAHAKLVPVGTVLPGESDAKAIVREAVDVHGVRAIKLHCHVQARAIDGPETIEVLETCAELGVPAIVHAGREPRLPGYPGDPHAFTGAERTRAALRKVPSLRLCVPHLGYDEIAEYIAMLDEHEGLYLDTTMSCAEYFDDRPDIGAVERHADRVMYGSDFFLTPYDADREIVALARAVESDDAFEKITRTTARAFFRL